MRFLSYEADGVDGLAVDRGDGFRGLPATAAFFPGRLDDIVRSGDFVNAPPSKVHPIAFQLHDGGEQSRGRGTSISR